MESKNKRKKKKIISIDDQMEMQLQLQIPEMEKKPAQPEDPVEIALLNRAAPSDIIRPQAVLQAVVTMEPVSDILRDAQVANDIDQLISNETNGAVQKVTLTDDVLETGVVKRHLGLLDRAVLEAVLSQLVAGNNVFTSSMLYRTMTGRSTGETVSQEQQRFVDEAMHRLMYTPIQIDLSIYGKDDASERDIVLSGAAVPAERLKMNIGGTECTAYQVSGIPIIYRFCKATQTLTTSPADIMSISSINYTKRSLAIMNYLIGKIVPLLYPVSGEYQQTDPIFISYENIYEIGMNEEDRRVPVKQIAPQIKRRMRDTVDCILTEWKERGYIENWKIEMRNREYLGCHISLPVQPPALPSRTPKLIDPGTMHRK